jgi:hypothetical protein
MKEQRPPHRRPRRDAAPPIPTLGDLEHSAGRYGQPDWLWVGCKGRLPTGTPCGRRTAMRLADMISRYGPDASSDIVRRNARCSVCGGKGAVLIAPSWNSAARGWQAFPDGDGGEKGGAAGSAARTRGWNRRRLTTLARRPLRDRRSQSA